MKEVFHLHEYRLKQGGFLSIEHLLLEIIPGTEARNLVQVVSLKAFAAIFQGSIPLLDQELLASDRGL